jgi:hypothetical protein
LLSSGPPLYTLIFHGACSLSNIPDQVCFSSVSARSSTADRLIPPIVFYDISLESPRGPCSSDSSGSFSSHGIVISIVNGFYSCHPYCFLSLSLSKMVLKLTLQTICLYNNLPLMERKQTPLCTWGLHAQRGPMPSKHMSS